MSGFLTRVFDPGEAGGERAASSGDSDSEVSGNNVDQTASGEVGTGIDVTIPLHLQAGMEYQTENGSGGWSNTTDATLTVSTSALLGAASEASFSDESASS